MAIIRVKTGPNKGKIYPVEGAPLTVGREENQVIQILDQGVSRGHAEIFRLGEMCFVRDLNSTNGTFVNDEKVSEEVLKAGDELLIGTTILVFEEAPPKEGSVEFEGEDAGKIDTPTVELRVGGQATRPLGKEVQSRQLTLLGQMGRIARESRTLKQVHERVLELLCTAVGAGQGYLFGFDPATGKPVARALVEAADAGGDKKVSRSILQRVLQSGQPLLTNDAALDGRFSLSESVVLRKIKSVICAPVRGGEDQVSVLYLHSSNVEHGLSTEDLELATAAALQLSAVEESRAAVDRERRLLESLVGALMTSLEAGDPRGAGHAQRVSRYAGAIAVQMGLDEAEVHFVRIAGLVHDVGKMAVRRESPQATPEEVRRRHVQAAERVLTGIEGFEKVLPAVRYHHERADGSGQPYGVKNADMPVAARILIVANHFADACDGGRDVKEVVREIAAKAGPDFDADVVNALAVCHRNGSLFEGGRP